MENKTQDLMQTRDQLVLAERRLKAELVNISHRLRDVRALLAGERNANGGE